MSRRKHAAKASAASRVTAIRREKASYLLKWQLAAISKKQRDFPHMIYSSTTVDVAANIALVIETAVIRTILDET